MANWKDPIFGVLSKNNVCIWQRFRCHFSVCRTQLEIECERITKSFPTKYAMHLRIWARSEICCIEFDWYFEFAILYRSTYPLCIQSRTINSISVFGYRFSSLFIFFTPEHQAQKITFAHKHLPSHKCPLYLVWLFLFFPFMFINL